MNTITGSISKSIAINKPVAISRWIFVVKSLERVSSLSNNSDSIPHNSAIYKLQRCTLKDNRNILVARIISSCSNN